MPSWTSDTAVGFFSIAAQWYNACAGATVLLLAEAKDIYVTVLVLHACSEWHLSEMHSLDGMHVAVTVAHLKSVPVDWSKLLPSFTA